MTLTSITHPTLGQDAEWAFFSTSVFSRRARGTCCTFAQGSFIFWDRFGAAFGFGVVFCFFEAAFALAALVRAELFAEALGFALADGLALARYHKALVHIIGNGNCTAQIF